MLDTLRLSDPRGRRVLVMGDMLELGRVEGALHREAGKRAASAGVQAAVRCGPAVARRGRNGTPRGRSRGPPPRRFRARRAESIAEFLKDGDLIVVKGSRGMRMERVVQALIAQCGEA